MTEDIRKQIEEEAREYAINKHSDDIVWEIDRFETRQDFDAGANFILSKWQETTRWRKVGEELPDGDIYVLVGNPSSSYYYVAKWYSKQNRFVDTRGHTLYYSKELKWQPINP